MSLRRREQLVRLARQYDALVISDDVYDWLSWQPTHDGLAIIPRLVDIDQTLDGGVSSPYGNVVSNGSFSKVLGPGLRTGWTESTDLFAAGLSQCGSTQSGGSPSQFAAAIIAEIMQSGALEQHLRSVLIPTYQYRSAAMVEAVQEHLIPHGVIFDLTKSEPGRKPPTVEGGYFIYLQLPENIDVTKFAVLADKEQNVIVGKENFEVRGDRLSVPVKNSIRMCFAWEDIDRIREGTRRLGKVLAIMMAG